MPCEVLCLSRPPAGVPVSSWMTGLVTHPPSIFGSSLSPCSPHLSKISGTFSPFLPISTLALLFIRLSFTVGVITHEMLVLQMANGAITMLPDTGPPQARILVTWIRFIQTQGRQWVDECQSTFRNPKAKPTGWLGRCSVGGRGGEGIKEYYFSVKSNNFHLYTI